MTLTVYVIRYDHVKPEQKSLLMITLRICYMVQIREYFTVPVYSYCIRDLCIYLADIDDLFGSVGAQNSGTGLKSLTALMFVIEAVHMVRFIMTLPSGHRIPNSIPGDLRFRTLPLGHGDSPQKEPLKSVDRSRTQCRLRTSLCRDFTKIV